MKRLVKHRTSSDSLRTGIWGAASYKNKFSVKLVVESVCQLEEIGRGTWEGSETSEDVDLPQGC